MYNVYGVYVRFKVKLNVKIKIKLWLCFLLISVLKTTATPFFRSTYECVNFKVKSNLKEEFAP